MSIFIMSDIHGSVHFLKEALEAFKKEKSEYIIMLGDALYHGPRNILPADYNPAEVAKLLNKFSHKIIAVRGNCDSEVDQMIISYPMMSDYSFILHNNRRVFLTHGHLYNPENLPCLSKGDIFAFGHTHIPQIEGKDGILIINPGSISLSKGNYLNSYGVLSDSHFKIKALDGTIIKEVELDNINS